MNRSYCKYITYKKAEFFTVILLPDTGEKFPTVVYRSPYVNDMTDEEALALYEKMFGAWTCRGYAFVYQHCRGQGKSTGEFIPYIHEREDGLALTEWIRKQSFYNGELYLTGASYEASLHYTMAPFAEDIKGAAFEVQDSERYRLWYRNGQMRRGHANWHFGLYKRKCNLPKSFDANSFSHLPIKNLSLTALGEVAEDFEKMLEASDENHPFWQTRYGGAEARGATDNANIPLLLTTSYNDYYTGGVFDMWRKMSESTREKSALLVSAYNHGDGFDKEKGIEFPCASRREKFGQHYCIDWFDSIRNGTKLPYSLGKVTYYRTFEDKWGEDFYSGDVKDKVLTLGKGEREIEYDPLNPTYFSEIGLIEEKQDRKKDIISLYTDPAEEKLFVRGKMRVELTVSSDSPDTSFFVKISIKLPGRDYGLRSDITAISRQVESYGEGDKIKLDFCFDEYAFAICKGGSLRIDIAPTDASAYVCHTNNKGPYYIQESAKKAHNKVYLNESYLILPIEIQ